VVDGTTELTTYSAGTIPNNHYMWRGLLTNCQSGQYSLKLGEHLWPTGFLWVCQLYLAEVPCKLQSNISIA